MTDERKYLVYDSRACGGDPADLDRASCLAMGDSPEEAKDFVREYNFAAHNLKACACFSYPVEDHQQGEDAVPIIQGPARWEWDWHRSTGFLTNRQDL